MLTNIKRSQAGFSLVELLVVMSIFLIMTAVVLYNQNKFSSNISISNAAYELALQIRQAQVYGTLVRQDTSGSFNQAYGMHFSYDGANAITYDLFYDDNDNLIFDADPVVSSNSSLGEGNVIAKICTYTITGANEKCFLSSGSGDLSHVDIVFKRPDPAALITDSLSATNFKGETRIYIKSALGDKVRIIKVFGSGQISVSALVDTSTVNF